MHVKIPSLSFPRSLSLSVTDIINDDIDDLTGFVSRAFSSVPMVPCVPMFSAVLCSDSNRDDLTWRSFDSDSDVFDRLNSDRDDVTWRSFDDFEWVSSGDFDTSDSSDSDRDDVNLEFISFGDFDWMSSGNLDSIDSIFVR